MSHWLSLYQVFHFAPITQCNGHKLALTTHVDQGCVGMTLR